MSNGFVAGVPKMTFYQYNDTRCNRFRTRQLIR